ncbi:VPEID-CTERM sorting domain-containing protein [Leisingera aquaemixtae]|uniref:VPEID-CTERM sorting domain-containing protein n=2 Tax=Leisingera aquaemixtae TaxID=1396826 RepID=A0ABY5WIF8_9RHOB|nr:VPEID-CTERM sorting domain-containing protein [Leisingera aquaemixtae]
MKNLFTALSTAFIVNCMTLSAALAKPGNGNGNGNGVGNGNGGNGNGNAHGVPEIDASAGVLALAAVGAALVLAWEVNRRRT